MLNLVENTTELYRSKWQHCCELKSAWRLLLLGLLAMQHVEMSVGARILAAFFFPGRSHFTMTNAIVRELIHRGHEVTFITPFTMAHEKLGANYTEILLPPFNVWKIVMEQTGAKSPLETAQVSTMTLIRIGHIMGLESTDFAFQQPALLDLIYAKNKTGKYDLLLAEQFFNEGALFLGHLYQIPIVTISADGFANHMSSFLGTIVPWSYVPHGYKPYTEHMTLMERMNNVYLCLSEEILRRFWYYPAQNALLENHFSHKFPELPTVRQMERNISVVLINTHMPMDKPKPMSFNTIPVGGLHITKARNLPVNVKRFLDDAEHGAIYFSLGPLIRSANLPPEKLKILLTVFGSLKQRVLWEFENDKMPNLPANVLVQKRMTQNDVLAHPRVKVFITPGGFFVTQDAVYYGVPMLGLPIISDQFINIEKSKAAGFALYVDYNQLTEDELRSSLTELLENPIYMNNMKRVSHIFRDRPLGAMDTAMFWMNYVIQHRGAPHMVAAGVDLNWFQFFLLDIVSIALIIILIPIVGIWLLCRRRKSIDTPKTKGKEN